MARGDHHGDGEWAQPNEWANSECACQHRDDHTITGAKDSSPMGHSGLPPLILTWWGEGDAWEGCGDGLGA